MAHDKDDADAGEGEEHGGGGGGKKKLFIIIGAALFLLIAACAGAFFTGLLDPLLGHKTETADAEDSHGAAAEPDSKEAKKGGEKGGDKGGEPPGPSGPVAFFDIPEMVVTLNSSPKSKAAFMKIRLSLELPRAEEIPRVQAAMPRIVDNLNGYLRELRAEELKGSAGAYRLKEEMLTRIKAAAAPARINAVLFKDLQVQ